MRKRVSALVGIVGVLTALALAVFGFAAGAVGGNGNNLMRWDLISLDTVAGQHTISPGGTASALAQNGEKLTLTGSGTFRSNPGRAQDVSGGGDWTTYATNGTTETGSGTYTVTGFVSYVPAPGAAPDPPFTDNITGQTANIRAGLAVFQITYSDGAEGVLTVSCTLPTTGTFGINDIFEGVTASKGYVDYWNHVGPTGGPPFTTGTNSGRTQFHVLN